MMVIGISVSEPSLEELIALGFGELHVRHAFIEIVRHVLALGGAIAYGGDLRAQGYTQALFDLVRTYNPNDVRGSERVHAFLAWPIWQVLSPSDRADLVSVATTVEVAPPEGAPPTLPPLKERTAEERLWNSRSLTKMRNKMTSTIAARVVLGGRVSGQQGLLPGVFEEAVLALQAEKPLYIAGGFGGCGRMLVSAIQGSKSEELTLTYQSEHGSHYSELYDYATSVGAAPSFDDLQGMVRNAGIAGLNNGLDGQENERLFVTDDVDEMVALLIRGLRRVFGARS